MNTEQYPDPMNRYETKLPKREILRGVPLDDKYHYSLEFEEVQDEDDDEESPLRKKYYICVKDNQGNTTLDLGKEFLPEGGNFVQISSPKSSGRNIGFPLEKWTDPREISRLAHEGGHVNTGAEFKGQWSTRMPELKKEIIRAAEKKSRSLPLLIKEWTDSGYDKFIEVERKREERASQWGMDKLKEIKQRTGIDLLSCFKDEEEIKASFNEGLASYDESNQRLKEIINGNQ